MIFEVQGDKIVVPGNVVIENTEFMRLKILEIKKDEKISEATARTFTRENYALPSQGLSSKSIG